MSYSLPTYSTYRGSSGCTATAVSPTLVSSRVVAMAIRSDFYMNWYVIEYDVILLAHIFYISWIIRMYCNCGITNLGLKSGSCNGDQIGFLYELVRHRIRCHTPCPHILHIVDHQDVLQLRYHQPWSQVG